MTHGHPPFELKGVVHLIRPSGQRARNLDELRAVVEASEPRALFVHCVQYQLRHPAADELPPDDFSGWVEGVVQDRETAERLSYVVQTRGRDAQELRAGILDVLDSIPQAVRVSRDAPEHADFIFHAGESVVFPTGQAAASGRELMTLLAEEDASVWFYHLVEEPWFLDGRMPITEWLADAGQPRLASRLREYAADGIPLGQIRRKSLVTWNRTRLTRRVADAAAAPEDERREAGRAAVARLARRLAPPKERP